MTSIFHRKTIEEAVEIEKGKEKFERTLGLLSLIFIGVGCIIGAGIFIASGLAAAVAGPSVIISFIIGAILCAFISFCYAELTSIITVSGGLYTYCQVALGEVYAYLAGVIHITEYTVVAAVVAIGWSGYFYGLFKSLGIILPSFGLINLPAILIILVLAAIVALGSKESTTVNNLIVIVNVAIIIIFGVVGGLFINPANFVPFAPLGLTGILTGTVMVFFAFTGFDAVASAAEEAKNPKRNLPLGIIISLLFCSILYILMAVVLTGMVPYTSFAGLDIPIQFALEYVGLNWLMTVVTTGVLAGLTTTLLVSLFVIPRTMFAMSRDGLLPKSLGRLHKRFKSPFNAVVLVAGISMFLAGFAPLASIFDLVNGLTLLIFILVAVCTIRIRQLNPGMIIPFPVPLYPYVPIAAIIGCALLMTQLQLISVAIIIGLLGISLLAYLKFRK